MGTPSKWINEVVAYATGQEIEWRDHTLEWTSRGVGPLYNPLTHECRSWRIKPVAPPDRVRFINILESATACNPFAKANVKVIFDGETEELKSVELMK